MAGIRQTIGEEYQKDFERVGQVKNMSDRDRCAQISDTSYKGNRTLTGKWSSMVLSQ